MHLPLFTHKTHKEKRGFTFIEVLVAVTITTVIATLITVNYSETRRRTRDSIRRADVDVLLTAVGQYAVASGTSFIKNGECTIGETVADQTDPMKSLAGGGCTGAAGRAYGRVNQVGGTAPNTSLSTGASPSPSNSGNSSTVSRTYAGKSITTALNELGYLNTVPKDPLNPKNEVRKRDYLLVRACPDGRQHVGSDGSVFAVWTQLEKKPTSNETEEMLRVAGNPLAKPETYKSSDGESHTLTPGYDLATEDHARFVNSSKSLKERILCPDKSLKERILCPDPSDTRERTTIVYGFGKSNAPTQPDTAVSLSCKVTLSSS